jgi:uncharacterized membrane protein
MSHRAKRPSAPGGAFVPADSSSSHSSAQQGAAEQFPSEHKRGLLPEPFFRWRGGEITRLEAFCDVVFGFALTLLVVSLEVPRTYAEMMTAMRGFLPFAVCFAQLVMIWVAHYRFSRRFGLEDPYTVLLNIILLFLVLFYVYPLKFVFTLVFGQIMGRALVGGIGWHEAAVLMRIYAVGFVAVFSLFSLLYAHAYKLRNALELNEVEVLLTRYEIEKTLLMAAVGAVSFALTFKNPAWAGWWYFVLGPALGFQGSIAGKRVRAAAEKLGLA